MTQKPTRKDIVDAVRARKESKVLEQVGLEKAISGILEFYYPNQKKETVDLQAYNLFAVKNPFINDFGTYFDAISHHFGKVADSDNFQRFCSGMDKALYVMRRYPGKEQYYYYSNFIQEKELDFKDFNKLMEEFHDRNYY